MFKKSSKDAPFHPEDYVLPAKNWYMFRYTSFACGPSNTFVTRFFLNFGTCLFFEINILSQYLQGVHVIDLILETMKFVLAMISPFSETMLQLVILSSTGVSSTKLS